MKPPHAFAHKGPVVEDWADLRFFRPLGFRVATALAPRGVSPDQVTLASLALGLLAGHLFLYASVRLNALGLALFVLSDVLDSADGQLARLRGSSTRLGRVLDGMSDSLRFVNLYVHLTLRLIAAGGGWGGLGLAAVALWSHSLQSAAVDFIRHAYLRVGGSAASELDLPEEVARSGASWPHRVAGFLYRDYVRRQAWLFPKTVALLRALGGGREMRAVRNEYRARQAPLVGRCAWIAQNIRFALLAGTAVVGWPAGFFWITAIPLSLVLVGLVAAHERHATQLLDGLSAEVSVDAQPA